jgi:hypothetical protein
MSNRSRVMSGAGASDPIPRRGSLRALGCAALAAGAVRISTTAAKQKQKQKQNRKRKRDKRNAPNARCEGQVAVCQEIVAGFCVGTADPSACQARLRPCCEPLAACQADGFVACFNNVFVENP